MGTRLANPYSPILVHGQVSNHLNNLEEAFPGVLSVVTYTFYNITFSIEFNRIQIKHLDKLCQ
jgi:hypothetical protein